MSVASRAVALVVPCIDIALLVELSTLVNKHRLAYPSHVLAIILGLVATSFALRVIQAMTWFSRSKLLTMLGVVSSVASAYLSAILVGATDNNASVFGRVAAAPQSAAPVNALCITAAIMCALEISIFHAYSVASEAPTKIDPPPPLSRSFKTLVGFEAGIAICALGLLLFQVVVGFEAAGSSVGALGIKDTIRSVNILNTVSVAASFLTFMMCAVVAAFSRHADALEHGYYQFWRMARTSCAILAAFTSATAWGMAAPTISVLATQRAALDAGLNIALKKPITALVDVELASFISLLAFIMLLHLIIVVMPDNR